MKNPAKIVMVLLSIILLGSTALLLLSVTSGDSPQLITSDGKAYYAWVRSIVIDRDIDFSNDYAMVYPPDPLPPEAEQLTPIGLVVNKYPIGLAILELPGVFAGHLIARISGSIPDNGLSWPYQWCVAFSLSLFSLVGIYFLYRTMILLGSNSHHAVLFSISSVLCTNLVHYVAKEPAMPHAAGMAVICMLVYDMISRGEKSDDICTWRVFGWGTLIGLLFLLRNSNIFVLPFVGTLLWRCKLLRPRMVMVLMTGFLAISLLQPVSLHALWGTFRITTYPNEGLTGSWIGIYKTLFSYRHGLIVYHPWYAVLLGITILGLWKPALRLLSASVIVSFFFLATINGLWLCWWFGDSFGNRSFVDILPLLSITAALVTSQFQASPNRIVTLTSLALFFGCLNIYLWVGYLLHQYPHDGNHGVCEAYSWPTVRADATERITPD